MLKFKKKLLIGAALAAAAAVASYLGFPEVAEKLHEIGSYIGLM